MSNNRVLVPIGALVLTACGGGSSSEDPVAFEPVQEVPEFNQMTVPLGSLQESNAATFERHLKHGIFMRGHNEYRVTFGDTMENAASQSASAGNFSSTNVQEQGVDEADRIKYDGQYLFIAEQNDVYSIMEEDAEDKPAPTSLRVMERDASGRMTQVNQFVVEDDANTINGIYLHDQRLAVLSDIYDYNIAAMSIDIGFFPMNNQFNLTVMDVNNPASPSELLSYTIDGAIINSRRINDILYVVSSYRASMEGIVYADNDKEKVDQYNALMQEDIKNLLPKYTDSEGNSFPLIDGDSCLLPEQATVKDGFDGIVTITAIDLTNPTEFKSSCVNAEVQGLYASSSSLYLYGTQYNYDGENSSETSVIHKFNLAGTESNYRASGELEGRFNWNLSNLRFSENGEYLRVVTTSGDRGQGYQHRLNVLSEDGNKLSLVSQLPNAINSTPIGKVEEDGKVYEDIEAVRFYGDQAYIVTFLNTDPLYVIDLKNHSEPLIKGALEVPGYSAYLHPISDSLLLGVGQNVEPGQIRGDNDETTETDTSSPIIEGAKVSLFNISDMSNPLEIKSIVYEQAYTPVEFDYHALTYLTMQDGSTRFALPIERWISETKVDEKEQKFDVWYTENKLAVLEVTTSGVDAQLREVGQIKATREDGDLYNGAGWRDRSIFHDEHVYYIHGSKVWHTLWPDLTELSGPY